MSPSRNGKKRHGKGNPRRKKVKIRTRLRVKVPSRRERFARWWAELSGIRRFGAWTIVWVVFAVGLYFTLAWAMHILDSRPWSRSWR